VKKCDRKAGKLMGEFQHRKPNILLLPFECGTAGEELPEHSYTTCFYIFPSFTPETDFV
jgi:hypothetical protein